MYSVTRPLASTTTKPLIEVVICIMPNGETVRMLTHDAAGTNQQTKKRLGSKCCPNLLAGQENCSAKSITFPTPSLRLVLAA
jgi:hypothetical protein